MLVVSRHKWEGCFLMLKFGFDNVGENGLRSSPMYEVSSNMFEFVVPVS